MKLYTKSGDDGRTGLFGGQRVSKDDARLEACGTVDELNAALGMARAAAGASGLAPALERVQGVLLRIGAVLATPPGKTPGVRPPSTREVTALERAIDKGSRMVELSGFILPGGCELAARLHLARTICRRAERRIVTLARTTPLPGRLLAYLNRLSDYLYLAARLANLNAQTREIPWRRERRSSR